MDADVELSALTNTWRTVDPEVFPTCTPSPTLANVEPLPVALEIAAPATTPPTAPPATLELIARLPEADTVTVSADLICVLASIKAI